MSLGSAREANFPRADCELVGFTFTPKTPASKAECEAVIADVNKYLGGFAWTDGKCPGCDRELGGLFGTFQWGLAHGEGTCCKCSWPCRAYHRIKDSEGGDIFAEPFPMILAYHPDDVEKRTDDSEENSDENG